MVEGRTPRIRCGGVSELEHVAHSAHRLDQAQVCWILKKSLRDKSSSLNKLLSGTLRNANLFLTSLNFQLTTVCYRCGMKIFA